MPERFCSPSMAGAPNLDRRAGPNAFREPQVQILPTLRPLWFAFKPSRPAAGNGRIHSGEPSIGNRIKSSNSPILVSYERIGCGYHQGGKIGSGRGLMVPAGTL